ncbi:hypothetical protein ACMD2_00833 [Ananas comosus]|uniref:WW domain-containing protein n=1 Tax=Ananas comosus TaxID=4615 RepID=A0A199ULK2_ANACO|nr:hypothetical protein ACMD2_00833 [Ananas comosus]
MGKRKERRLATMMAANRRVKLDLFAEPSGQKEANPLLLLGQYSDDELEEQVIEQPNQAANDSSTVPSGLVEDSSDMHGNVGNNTAEASAAGDTQQEAAQQDSAKISNDGDQKENNAFPAIQPRENEPTIHSLPNASEMQIIGDISGDWKIVMHEESNQCYYWNTVTGETSWEMPNGLDLKTGTTADGMAVDGQMPYPIESQAVADNTLGAYPGVLASENSEMGAYGNSAFDTSEQPTQYSTVLVGMPSAESAARNLSSSLEDKAVTTEAADIHSAQLVKHGEDLLRRLMLLEGSFDGFELIKREIEIRVSDCKVLSSYGLSLLPFWWHTETQLKQLESTINKVEASSHFESRSCEKTGSQQNPSSKRQSEVIDKSNPPIVVQNIVSSPRTEACNTIDESENVKSNVVIKKEEEEVMLSKVESHIEDVDMDVEMEVDDEENVRGETFPVNTSTDEYPAPSEKILPPNSSLSPLEDATVPPPPEEEFIPPPPPDSEESVPPPPPEEPAVLYPPYAVIPPAYPDQYNIGYTIPTYEYYSPVVSEATNVTYYAPGGSHIIEPQPPSYYEPVTASSALPVSIDVAPVEPIAYNSFSSGVVVPLPVVSSAESTAYYVAAGPTISDITPIVPSVETENSSLSTLKGEPSISAIIAKSEESAVNKGSAASTAPAPGMPSVNGSSTTVASLANPKDQSKVVRSKKRTVSVAPMLRSIKKVSSLVDKWKAAKEELHGEEDEEPESAYEILERKRQKEIEKWRARQISSGEAEDNANFVPLRGDWRDRVKRRRARAKESEDSEIPALASGNEKKQPDLTELSKGLPSGWQAYWDESTKEVYYGNSITSETTWIRPTT